jgi:uncharacterized delta-60 repeat protein
MRTLARPLVLFLLVADAALPLAAADGELDLAFSGDGRATVDFEVPADADDSALALAADPAGRLLIGGRSCSEDSSCLASIARLLPDGAFDPEWDGDGRRLFLFGDGDGVHEVTDFLADSALGPVIVAGRFRSSDDPSYYEIGLARLLENGTLDPSFGEAATPGTVATALPSGSVATVEAVARTSTGEILVAGSGESAPSEYDAFVARFTSAGVLDPTFGDDGVAWVALHPDPGAADLLVDLDLQDDHKIVVAAQVSEPGSAHFVVGVARLESDGDLDDEFDGDGRRLFEVNGSGTSIIDAVEELIVDPFGRILLSGASFGPGDPVWFVGRLLPGGATDPSFPFVLLDAGVPDGVLGGFLELESSGRLLLSGDTYDGDCIAARFDPATNALDPTYGTLGTARFFGPAAVPVECVASALHGGRLVVAGRVYDEEPADDDFFVARLTSTLIFRNGFESASTNGW